jgi:F-type H+-transporting ATPase subunit delta
MADSKDQQLHVAGVYAKALFDLAATAGKIEEVLAELESLSEAESNADVALFMRSDALHSDKREAGLERMFRGKLSDLVLNTLLVMSQHRRHGLVAALRRAYELCQERYAGEVEVTVTSAVELGDTQKQTVEHSAAEISGKKPLVAYVVDEQVLGGLVMQIGDMRYDNSVRRHLYEARQRLGARGARGLEVRVQ